MRVHTSPRMSFARLKSVFSSLSSCEMTEREKKRTTHVKCPCRHSGSAKQARRSVALAISDLVKTEVGRFDTSWCHSHFIVFHTLPGMQT